MRTLANLGSYETHKTCWLKNQKINFFYVLGLYKLSIYVPLTYSKTVFSFHHLWAWLWLYWKQPERKMYLFCCDAKKNQNAFIHKLQNRMVKDLSIRMTQKNRHFFPRTVKRKPRIRGKTKRNLQDKMY